MQPVTVLSRACTDLQWAEQAQVDCLPILRVVQNALQTDFGHAVCARIYSVRYTARLMSDMYAQDTALRRKALSKIRRKLGDFTPNLRVLQNALQADF